MDIKQVIKQSGIRQYEIAEYIGIHEVYLCQKLRKPIDADFERKILLAIRELLEEKGDCEKLQDYKTLIKDYKKKSIAEIEGNRALKNKEFDKLIQQVNEL